MCSSPTLMSPTAVPNPVSFRPSRSTSGPVARTCPRSTRCSDYRAPASPRADPRPVAPLLVPPNRPHPRYMFLVRLLPHHHHLRSLYLIHLVPVVHPQLRRLYPPPTITPPTSSPLPLHPLLLLFYPRPAPPLHPLQLPHPVSLPLLPPRRCLRASCRLPT